MIIAKFMQNFSDNPIVKAVFDGIRPTVAALILYAVLELCKISLLTLTGTTYVPNYTGIGVCLVLFVLMQIPRIRTWHPLVWISAGAALGIIFKLS